MSEDYVFYRTIPDDIEDVHYFIELMDYLIDESWNTALKAARNRDMLSKMAKFQ